MQCALNVNILGSIWHIIIGASTLSVSFLFPLEVLGQGIKSRAEHGRPGQEQTAASQTEGDSSEERVSSCDAWTKTWLCLSYTEPTQALTGFSHVTFYLSFCSSVGMPMNVGDRKCRGAATE